MQVELICDSCYQKFHIMDIADIGEPYPYEVSKIKEAYRDHRMSDECKKVFAPLKMPTEADLYF